MTGIPNEEISGERQDSRMSGHAAGAARFIVSLPFKIAGRVARHTVQILFAIFIVILHPQIKWLAALLADSYLVKNYVKPSLQVFAVHIYEPYFIYLSRLPPYWAAFSVALPLAVLEPAKLYATIMIAERPRTGIVLWLALQGLSLVLIDRTWTAVRPQSRKIWLVSRVHAWGSLNAAYGKYWIRNSLLYRTAVRWKKQARHAARSLWAGLVPRRRGKIR
ncbi:MAG: hypothetical protein ACLQF2_07500 [Rhodomicrobium sp.]